MELVGVDGIDILLDENGQPHPDGKGEAKLIEGEYCWLQDIRNEMETTEGELFYEEQIDTDAYGFSLIDFIHAEQGEDDFTANEIEQRIVEKLRKRPEIDGESIKVVIEYGNSCQAKIFFTKSQNNQIYNLEVDLSKIEVIADD